MFWREEEPKPTTLEEWAEAERRRIEKLFLPCDRAVALRTQDGLEALYRRCQAMLPPEERQDLEKILRLGVFMVSAEAGRV